MRLVIPSIIANGGSGGGGGGSATWGNISGTLSNQTDLQNALDSKIGIVDGELKVSNGDNIVVETENDSKTEIFSDSVSITADGQDSYEATISLNGVNGSILNLSDGSNSIDLKTNATDGATITKTENNITKSVLWEDQQSIKTYNAPSYTIDNNYGIIPNVDACTEVGMYKVVFETDQQAGGVGTFNYLLNVCITNMNNIDVISQTMIIPLTNGTGYIYRVGFNGTYQAWEGKILDTELAKCLQNTATGSGSVSILTDTTSANNIVAINANTNNGINNGDVVIGKYCYTSSIDQNYNRVVIGNNSSASGNRSVAIGNQCFAFGDQNGCVSIGAYSKTSGSGNAIAIGTGTSSSTNQHAEAKASNSIQLGNGTNAVANQFQVYEYPMLDGNTGKIPNERLRIIVADTSSTSATIANVEGGKDYTFSQALTALSITAITSSFVEANIYFTAGTSIAVTLPQGTNTIGNFTFAPNKSYVISICNGIAVRGELN